MKCAVWAGLLTMLVATVAVNGATGTNLAYAMRHQTRSVNGVQVSLTPLFNWWRSGGTSGTRPMPAWERVTCGDPEKTVAGTWIVSARIEHLPGEWRDEKIVLKHPPIREWQRFHNLQAANTNLIATQQKGYARATAAGDDAKSSRQAAGRASELSGITDGQTHYNAQQAAASASRSADKAKAREDAAMQDARDANRERSEVVKQLQAFPSTTAYQMDTFALRTAEKRDGLTVYEVGYVAGW